jgi:hypothetical protein
MATPFLGRWGRLEPFETVVASRPSRLGCFDAFDANALLGKLPCHRKGEIDSETLPINLSLQRIGELRPAAT